MALSIILIIIIKIAVKPVQNHRLHGFLFHDGFTENVITEATMMKRAACFVPYAVSILAFL